MDYYIFGAKSIAIGTYRALKALYPTKNFCGFVVTSAEGNPTDIEGFSVREIAAVFTF